MIQTTISFEDFKKMLEAKIALIYLRQKKLKIPDNRELTDNLKLSIAFFLSLP